ncbi:hypothetical protein D049_1530A, partial [Vibrio parahaemolyticus VPTS-2010]
MGNVSELPIKGVQNH